ncbi:MAG: hypothetical protein ACHP6H_06330 [Legionellales bacterium]
MKNCILIIVAVAGLLFSGCNKDNASKWVGTYMGTNGTNVNQIVITEVDKNTISIQLQTPYGGTFVTFVTIKAAKLTDATDAAIDEYGNILPDTVTSYHFTGTANLNGNTITFAGQGVNGNVTKTYAFTGSK